MKISDELVMWYIVFKNGTKLAFKVGNKDIIPMEDKTIDYDWEHEKDWYCVDIYPEELEEAGIEYHLCTDKDRDESPHIRISGIKEIISKPYKTPVTKKVS